MRPSVESQYSRPGMLRPLADRLRRVDQPATTLPSWTSTWDTITLRFHNSPEVKALARDHRDEVRAYYDAEFANAQGQSEKLADYLSTRLVDNTSPDYNPGLIASLSPIFRTVKSRFPQPIPTQETNR